MWLVGAAAGAPAQAITASLQATHDSDSFDELKETLAYIGAQGWGIKGGAMRYTAPGWSANGSLLAGTYKRDDGQTQLDASLGLARVASHDYLVGGLEYLQRLRPTTAVGFSVERDFVNSVQGIQSGITYTSLALVADHAFTDRFNVGVAAGTALFSNDNQRPILRTRWSYALNEAYGLNAFFKTRNYRNANPYRTEYFSPRRLQEASLGLSLRFAVAQAMVLNASMDAGQQRIDGASEPIWSASLGIASRRGSPVEWMAGIEASNSASLFTSQSASYRYTGAVARLKVPF